MKIQKLLFSSLLALCLAGYVNAQESTETPEVPATPAVERIESPTTPSPSDAAEVKEAVEEKVDPRGAKVSRSNPDIEGLDLSEEQAALIEDIKTHYSEKLKEMRMNGGGNTAEFRQLLQEFGAKQEKEIRAILTEVQLKQYDKLLETRKAGRTKAVQSTEGGQIPD